MAQQKSPAPAGAAPGQTLDAFLQRNRENIGLGLLVVGGAFLLVPLLNLIWLIQSKSANVPVAVWGFLVALTCLVGGLWIRLAEPTQNLGRLDVVRLAVLTVGSVVGLVTVLLGLWLPFGPWSFAFIPTPPNPGEAAVPIIRLWRENAWRITACAAALFFGLALMFASLQLARGAIRGNAVMRRLLFGYNTVLTGLLLFAVLFVVNVLAYLPIKPLTFFDHPVDWTPGQIFTLSDTTEKLLKSLDKAPKVTVMMWRNLIFTQDVQRLVDNMKKVDPRLEYRLIYPDKNPEDFETELLKYHIRFDDIFLPYRDEDGQPIKAGGVLVEYGSDHVFIPGRALFRPIQSQQRGPFRYAFLGEREMAKALRKLSEKAPAKIYFTQGNGELDLEDSDPLHFDQGAGLIKQHLLDRGNYEVLPLKLGIGTEAVPKDANVVVVARPMTPLNTRAVEALRAYLKREETKDKDGNVTQAKGKLLVLMDVVTSNDQMLQTGLEPLLREYNVEVGNDRLLSVEVFIGGGMRPSERPEDVKVMANPRSRNPVALAFSRGLGRRQFTFHTVRSVSSESQGGVMAGRGATAEALLISVEDAIWKTTNLTTPPQRLFREYLRTRPDERKDKMYNTMPVAVAVSDGGQTVPVPGHTPVPGKETPRMVVFGDATWVTNRALTQANGKDAKDLFTSCLSWLRERPDIGVDVKETVRPTFTLAGRLQEGTGAVSRLYWLPTLFVLLSVLALGGGVWVARRR